MWTHYIYLLSLPTLAIVSAQVMFPESDFYQVLLILGFPPVLMFTLFLANGYAIPASLPVAIILILTIPAQIAAGVFLFGGGSLWLFFAESAAVEINSFLLGMFFSAFSARRSALGGIGFILLLALAAAMFSGGVVSYVLLVYYGYGGWSPWLIFFLTALAAAFWEYAKVYKKTVEFHQKSKTPEIIVMKFDGGLITRALGIKNDVPRISPFRHPSGKNEMPRPILICGFTAMFLPLIAGFIFDIARR